jgi:hypothetical protein
MIDAAQDITTCLACGSTIIQISGRGHRKRQYCDDRCRQRAHRTRQAQEEGGQREASDQDAQARIAELEAENARLRQRLDVEARFHLDTEARHFKPWQRKQRIYTPGSFAQRFVDNKALPPQASRAHFEQLQRNLHYSDEEIETFRDLWKAMLLS